MTTNEMFAEILAKLEEMQANTEQSTSASSPSIPILTANTEDQERETSTTTLSTKLATTPSASLMSSPTSAPPQDANSIGLIVFTEDAAATPTQCSTPGHYKDTHVLASVNKSSATPIHPLEVALTILIGGSDDHEREASNSSSSNLVMVASTSPTPYLASAHSQGVDLGFQTGVTELLATSPSRCSTLALSQAAYIPVSIAPSSALSIAFLASTLLQKAMLDIPMVATMTSTMIDSSLDIDKGYGSCISSESYLAPYNLQDGCAAPRHKAADHAKPSHDAVREDDKILQDSHDRNGQGCMQPKPPWLLVTEVFRSWSGKLYLINGFLLEVSPWCRDYTMWVQWQPSMSPSPVQLQKASRGTVLQLLSCLFFVCTGAEAKQSKFLLVLMFGICYVELPIVHSNFQSYIWVSEVLSGKPVVLQFICRHDSKFLLQPWPPQLVIVNAKHHQLELNSQREIDGQLVRIGNCAVNL